MLTPLSALLFAALLAQQPGPRGPTSPDSSSLPTVVVRADDTKIDRSCRIEIPPGTVIQDAANDGVIQVVADGITVEFTPGSILRGCAPDTAPDTMTGTGIRIDGRKNVTLRGGAISGFKVGLLATKTTGLTIDGASFDDNFRQHLRSTPEAEDQSDWLWPHKNDDHEWRQNYGAALCIEEAAGLSVSNVTVRRGQNGIVLDRVTGSRLFDNDFSFLSGWGIAMWRSSSNAVCRNAIDFCVRGYSHGVYNRGQDSAGILMFEQCSGNLIAENSVTHCGDGIFGFAGREALGEAPPPSEGFSYERRGCNDNLIVGNDLSYAPAHGLEMTFSHGNRIFTNRFVKNAICGIWGGYSRSMVIAENQFEGNGEGSYGLERGGIDIEHGSGNLIVGNTFKGDKCGVHLWWDDDGELLKRPGVAAGYRGVSDNVISGNRFEGVATVLHLRDLSPGKDKVKGTVFSRNRVEGATNERDVTPGVEVATESDEPLYVVPEMRVIGQRKPVGARQLLGREQIIMTDWGPWDHAAPLVRKVASGEKGDIYAVLGAPEAALPASGGQVEIETLAPQPGEAARFAVHGGAGAALTPYSLAVTAGGQRLPVRGVAFTANWTIRVFPWAADPRTDLEGWRRGAEAKEAVTIAWPGPLSLPFGGAGPRSIPAWKDLRERLPGQSRYGLIAETTLRVPQGRWRVVTVSDDGVRVILGRPHAGGSVERSTLLENWTWHGPTRDAAEFDQPEDGPLGLTVEYFQIDGHAVLELRVEPLTG